jgi:hypothetical protein
LTGSDTGSSSTTTPEAAGSRTCAAVTPLQLPRGLEAVEDLIDDPARLGAGKTRPGPLARPRTTCLTGNGGQRRDISSDTYGFILSLALRGSLLPTSFFESLDTVDHH